MLAEGDAQIPRLALSKKLRAGAGLAVDQLWMRTVEPTGAELSTGRQVDTVDPANHRVASESGLRCRGRLRSTGAEPNPLDLPLSGADLGTAIGLG